MNARMAWLSGLEATPHPAHPPELSAVARVAASCVNEAVGWNGVGGGGGGGCTGGWNGGGGGGGGGGGCTGGWTGGGAGGCTGGAAPAGDRYSLAAKPGRPLNSTGAQPLVEPGPDTIGPAIVTVDPLGIITIAGIAVVGEGRRLSGSVCVVTRAVDPIVSPPTTIPGIAGTGRGRPGIAGSGSGKPGIAGVGGATGAAGTGVRYSLAANPCWP